MPKNYIKTEIFLQSTAFFQFSAWGHAVKSFRAIVVYKQVEGLHKASGLDLQQPQGGRCCKTNASKKSRYAREPLARRSQIKL